MASTKSVNWSGFLKKFYVRSKKEATFCVWQYSWIHKELLSFGGLILWSVLFYHKKGPHYYFPTVVLYYPLMH